MTPKLVSLAALALAVAGIAALFILHRFVATEPVGMAVQVLSAGLMVWARITFGARSFHAGADPTEGGLVTNGPYRYLRHPIYAAVTYFVFAGALSAPSAQGVGAATVIALCLGVRALLEEKLVAAAYPEYRDYAARTKRLIPFLF